MFDSYCVVFSEMSACCTVNVGTWWISRAGRHNASAAERVVVDTRCCNVDQTEICHNWWCVDSCQHPCLLWQVWKTRSAVFAGSWMSATFYLVIRVIQWTAHGLWLLWLLLLTMKYRDTYVVIRLSSSFFITPRGSTIKHNINGMKS